MIRSKVIVSLFLFVSLYLVYFSGYIFPLKGWGIIPREIIGLKGIFLSPFIHGDIHHLLNNSLPLLFLLLILSFNYTQSYFKVLLTLTLGTNLLVWIFASKAIHIGASGLIFSLTSFLIIQTFRNKLFGLFLPLVIFFLYYGNIFSGLIPLDFTNSTKPISYSSHWMGTVFGLLWGYVRPVNKQPLK